MKNFRIIPRLEIKNNYVIKGIKMEGLRKVGKPIEMTKKYLKDCADEIIFDDIVASLYNRKCDLNLIQKIADTINVPLAVSGGINSLAEITKIFNHGGDKIFMNTFALNNEKIISTAAEKYGSQSIGIKMQIKKFNDEYEVLTESGRSRTYIKAKDWIKKIKTLGAGEILLSSIDNDGTKNILNNNDLKYFRSLTDLPILYAGGVASKSDFVDLMKLGYDGCVVSRSLHFNEINIKNIKIELCKINNFINL